MLCANRASGRAAISIKLLGRGVEWCGATSSAGEGRPVSGLERLCGRLDLGDMFQSESSVVELIGEIFAAAHLLKTRMLFEN